MDDSKTLNETKDAELKSSVETNGSEITIDDASIESTSESKTEVDEFNLKYIKKELAYEVMSTPTVSSHEYRLTTFIILWARRNNINYEFDEYGNIYLTKGKLKEGEFYPCVTSHLDTVQHEQLTWAQVGLPLELKTRKNDKNQHEWYVDGMGIGADCKSGVVIALSLFEHFDKLKACFFLEEEIGCKGSHQLVTEWFDNVGYVIGWDSPELNRAAWSCSGVPLFNKDFFTSEIQEVCKKHGLTIFNAEPFTDVKIIREKTKIICMNFGNGGYNAHMSSEYCVVEDMDHACGMGIDIINKLGTREFKFETTSSYGSYQIGANGVKTWVKNTDSDFFKDFSGYKPYYTSNQTSATTTTKTSTTQTTSTQTTQNTDNKNTISLTDVEYITEIYELYIESIKEKVETKCKELNIDFDSFKNIFENKIEL